MAGGKLLILGGIRSGKSEFAESLVGQAERVLYVATAGHDDPTFASRLETHRFRRPASWETVETGSDPSLLVETIAKADSQWPLLVDDLGGWVTSLLDRGDSGYLVTQLADAVRDCPARLILVSPEVGLSVVPPTQVGVQFADLVGSLNQAVAGACDEVALVVAGQPTWLKTATPTTSTTPAASAADATSAAATSTAAASSPAAAVTPAAPPVIPVVVPPTAQAQQQIVDDTSDLRDQIAPAQESAAHQTPAQQAVHAAHAQGTSVEASIAHQAAIHDAATHDAAAHDAAAHDAAAHETAAHAAAHGAAVEGGHAETATAETATAEPATGETATAEPAAGATVASAMATAAGGETALTESTRALPIIETGLTIRPGMDLPIHDDEARSAAEAHLSKLEIPGSGLGALARTVVFAAGTQGRGVPAPWSRPHMVLLHGNHEGDIAAGDDFAQAALLADDARRGEGPIGLLAAELDVNLKVVDVPAAGDLAYGQTASREVIDEMLRLGWKITDDAVDSGADLIIVGSCGAGAEGTAAAVVAKVTGAEIAGLLGRIVGPDGSVDDTSWMLRCAAARDALHRTRNSDLNADTLLAELGGPDMAVIAGIILGATARRTAVMLDGPVGTAAALLARDLGSQSRLWSALPDHGGHPTTKAAADVLGLVPMLDLKVGLGEGATSLLALPLLRSALTLAATLPVKPEVLKAPPGFENVVD